MQNAIDIHAISEKIQQQAPLVDRVFSEMDRVIVGQRYMVERMLIGLICGGHILLEGVPGLAKTLTVSTLARILQASFKRIQFTPDLLPADLTGYANLQSPRRRFCSQDGSGLCQFSSGR